MMGGNSPPLPKHEMDELYNASFASVARSLFLLQQWKQAWDGAAAAAAFAGTDQYLANGHVRMSPRVTATVAPVPPVRPTPAAAAIIGNSSNLLAASTGGSTAPTAAPTGASAVSNEAMAAATALASVNPASTAPAASTLAAPPGTLKTTGPGTTPAGGGVSQPKNTDGNNAAEQDAAPA